MDVPHKQALVQYVPKSFSKHSYVPVVRQSECSADVQQLSESFEQLARLVSAFVVTPSLARIECLLENVHK